jgi:hypothetical protein
MLDFESESIADNSSRCPTLECYVRKDIMTLVFKCIYV